jgi:pimeloyl-ACP methyl ester carboxylesterase
MRSSAPYLPALFLLACTSVGAPGSTTPVEDLVTHDYADHDGVRLHYVTMGEGPLVVMLHGFPDYWYTWRDQMRALAGDHEVMAVDLRGYNRSDRPAGVDQYRMPILVEDVAAVIRHRGRQQATVVGHDWGGAIAWAFAMAHPEMT